MDNDDYDLEDFIAKFKALKEDTDPKFSSLPLYQKLTLAKLDHDGNNEHLVKKIVKELRKLEISSGAQDKVFYLLFL